MIEYRKAEPGDAYRIAPLLKDADREELLAVRDGETIADGLARSIWYSRETFAALDGDELLAIGGVAKAGAVGIPWMVTTTPALRFPCELVRKGRELADRWVKEYGLLENFVHVKNTVSRLWLKRLGFSEKPAPYYHPDFVRVIRRV